MNRKERRRLQKAGGARPQAGAVPARTRSVSDMLLGLGGVRVPVAPAPAAAELPADPVHAALAQLRLNESLAAELARQQQALHAHPDSTALLNSVAKLQIRLDRRADALLSYRRLLALQPDHAEAAHMVGVLSGTAPEKPDATYVASMFDAFADSFDEKLTQWLEYRAPQQVAQAARHALGTARTKRAIDLGCGTGLLAPEVRELVDRLDGVDLSPRMVDKARERRLYDELLVGDILALLGSRRDVYDLALAADVLSYFGDLKQLFATVHASLKEGGIFVATVEKGTGARYQAAKTGRYQHGEAYLRKRAYEAGFTLVGFDEIVLRKEENQPVHGYVFALRRETDAAAAEAVPAVSQETLLAALDAPGAGIVMAAAHQVISNDFAVAWSIDLGGGMARHAAALRSLAQHVDMVTPDPARCRQAFEAGLYDECDSDGIVPFLESRPDHFDLIMMPDPASAPEDPALLFSAVKIALALAGVFIAVLPSGPHDAAALRDMAKAEGLIVLAVEPVVTADGSVAICLVAES